MDKIDVLALFGMAVVVGGLIFFLCFVSHDVQTRINYANEFQNELEEMGFTVMEGIVQSPSLVIQLSRNDFITKVTELNTTVYRHTWQFYVFEPNMLTAYRY